MRGLCLSAAPKEGGREGRGVGGREGGEGGRARTWQSPCWRCG